MGKTSHIVHFEPTKIGRRFWVGWMGIWVLPEERRISIYWRENGETKQQSLCV